MDQVTQFFISEYDNILNIGFVCNLMIFLSVLNCISVIIGQISSVGK